MTNLIYHFYKYGEVYMFGAAFCITSIMYGLLFYELKKHPNLVLEIRNDDEEEKKG